MRWRYSRETENEINANGLGVRVFVAFCDFRGIDTSTNASQSIKSYARLAAKVEL